MPQIKRAAAEIDYRIIERQLIDPAQSGSAIEHRRRDIGEIEIHIAHLKIADAELARSAAIDPLQMIAAEIVGEPFRRDKHSCAYACLLVDERERRAGIE